MVCFKVFLLVLMFCFFAREISSNKSNERSWRVFLQTYNKTYHNASEYEYRKKIFKTNVRKIDKFNRNYVANNLFFKCAVNRYADLTNEEFVKVFTGFKFQGLPPDTNVTQRSTSFTVATFDWRGRAVTSVKRQEKCGACWSFAAAGALEGQIYLKKKRLISLSPQNLIDCVETDETSGCSGGIMTDAYEWISHNGIESESDYQYEARDDRSCRYQPLKRNASCSGFYQLPFGSEDDLKRFVTTIGPISVGIDAKYETLQFYSSGVYYEPNCDPLNINHAVLVVGYGTDENDQDYWIIKNSWGIFWGENGYLRLARNRNNHCGVATFGSYPIVT